MADIYDETAANFNAWLRFVLDDTKPSILGFQGVSHLGLGFISYRFLELSIKQPRSTLRAANSYDDVWDIYRSQRIVNELIRTEELNDGLQRLASGPLAEYFDQNKVRKFFGAPPEARRAPCVSA
jgi:hypothetical protein